MLEVLAVVAIVVAVAVALLVAYAAGRPDRFEVKRSLNIAAPAERIFPLIADLRRFNTWNPFATKDPGAQGTYDGPASGKGARFAFSGGKSGTGRIDILDAAPPSKVTMRLVMVKPMAADNRVDFILEPQGAGTRVTWAMSGPLPLFGRIMHLFINCDRMVGREFEAGLASLAAEAAR